MDPVLKTLQSGEIALRGLLSYSSNYTFLVNVSAGEAELTAVYKPTKGEQPLWDFPSETLARREVAAYVVSEALGWNFVPPTVFRDDGPHGPGSVQLFVDADPETHYFTFPDEEKRGLGRVVAFDVLLNNADRKSGHVFKDEQGKVWLIDHGICFHVEPKLRTVIWELGGEPVAEDILRDVECFQQSLAGDAELKGQLEPLLTPRELRALQRRAARLIGNPRYPLPGPGRNYPWPPV